MIKLKLYVLGKTPDLTKTVKTLTKLFDGKCEKKYSLDVVDLLMNPQLAEEDKIFATPTLVKKLPLPVRKVIGDLSCRKNMLVGLDILNKK